MMKVTGYFATRSKFLAIIAMAFAALANVATAAPRMRCTGAPFSFTDLQTTAFGRQGNHVNIAWMGPGMTTLYCPDGSVLGIDVWEHAYVAVPRGQVGMDSNGDRRSIGRVELGVTVPDGGTIILGGYMHGSEYGCDDGICVVDMEVRASARGGGKLRMLQRVTIDPATRMVTRVDVASIVIEFTSAG